MKHNLTLQAQGSPVLLLAYLHRENSYLPAAEFHLSPIYAERLEISLHDDLPGFEVWRVALGLEVPMPRNRDETSWVVVDGVVDDVRVRLTGFASADEVTAYDLAESAVSA
ncbi:hypothetical protein ACIQPT_34655 [Streptomyces sp. NPDC091289]|uniref:hypothetical protein n=1 Tax=Streptomyces sp. NPDC091289 TaxID=3365989 RepID=UPI003800C1A8